MSDIKLTIDGTEYELYEATHYRGFTNIPFLCYNGKEYYGKEMPKEKDIPKDWEIVAFIWNVKGFKLKDEIYFDENMNIASLSFLLQEVGFGKATIHSVRRGSDGEVFTVGDKTNYGVIEKFSIERGNKLFVNCGNPYITHISDIYHKPKVPLFTTEDGCQIFEGDHYFSLSKEFNRTGRSNGLGWYRPEQGEKYFSTSEKRDEYIQLYKPVEVTQKELIDNFIVLIRSSGKYDSLSTFFQAKIKP